MRANHTILVLVTMALGCDPNTIGNGDVVDVERIVKGFSAVEITGLMSADVEIGPESAVFLRTDDNLIQYIETQVDGDGTLVAGPEKGRELEPTELHLTVTAPILNSATLLGSGKLKINGLDADQFAIVSEGTGPVTAEGSANVLTVDTKSDGAVDAVRLVATDVELLLEGDGTVEVHGSESVTGSSSGAGDVHVFGKPPVVDVRMYGDGELIVH